MYSSSCFDSQQWGASGHKRGNIYQCVIICVATCVLLRSRLLHACTFAVAYYAV